MESLCVAPTPAAASVRPCGAGEGVTVRQGQKGLMGQKISTKKVKKHKEIERGKKTVTANEKKDRDTKEGEEVGQAGSGEVKMSTDVFRKKPKGKKNNNNKLQEREYKRRMLGMEAEVK